MHPPESKVTTEILWLGALIFGLVDIPFVVILARRIDRELFRQLRSVLIVTTGIFWCAIWGLMSLVYWEAVYHYVFPAWARWLIPPVYGCLFAGVALLFWSLSFRIPGRPVLNFCVLGGLWGTVTHIWGISRGLLEKPPMLQGTSPIAATIMPFFEFVFYWCTILTIALLLHRARVRRSPL
jgi:FtsH-binding integral membrane protein